MTWRLPSTLTLLGWAVLAANACGSSETESGTAAVTDCDGTWESVRDEVLAPTCGVESCHGATASAVGLDLSGTARPEALVGAGSGSCDGWVRVVPGAPERSLLWQKIYSESPPCGEPMPPAHHLRAAELACVRTWIRGLDAADGGGGPPGCETCGGAACVDLATDPARCGACDVACPAGAGCQGGVCACDGSLTACGAACVDTEASSTHCGACDVACPSGALCSVGECICPGALTACDGACVDTGSDPGHCGACGAACGASEVCLAGACSAGCGALTNCNGACVDTQASSFNCGACGAACPVGASCIGGTCACPSGSADCGGVCLNVLSDPAHCGTCTNVCGAGTVCDAGECRCPGGGTACGGRCVDTTADPASCGGCGVTCGSGQTCQDGTCRCGSAGASFAADIQPILTESCAVRGCHGSVAPKEGLDLSPGAAYGNLVGVPSGQCGGRPLVAPGDPAGSYLMDKLLGVDLCFGTRMPKADSTLPQAQLDAIGAWICQGAKND